MSGRGKRILYQIFDVVLWLCTAASVVLLLLLTVPKDDPEIAEFLALDALILCCLFRIPVLIHELGHLLFGLIAGMRPAAFMISGICISSKGVRYVGSKAAGMTAMYPKNGRNVRGKTLALSLGGALFGLLLGGVMLALYFALPYHPALLFFAFLAFFVLYEAIRALIPVELYTGKTDGAVIRGILKHAPEEEIMLRVLTVQGILFKGTFSEIPRELLYDVPVVREDLPARRALLALRVQYELAHKNEDDARKLLKEFADLEEYFSQDEADFLSRYENYFSGVFEAEKKQPLFGIRELENSLSESIKKEPCDEQDPSISM